MDGVGSRGLARAIDSAVGDLVRSPQVGAPVRHWAHGIRKEGGSQDVELLHDLDYAAQGESCCGGLHA
jgi:hypothetical protein